MKVNEAKSAAALPEERKFLGFIIEWCGRGGGARRPPIPIFDNPFASWLSRDSPVDQRIDISLALQGFDGRADSRSSASASVNVFGGCSPAG